MIKLLEPDLPAASELLPWLERIDTARWYTNFGPLVREFERALHGLFPGVENLCLTTVANGTAALELAVQALALPPGGRVLMPTYTFPATLAAVWRSGLVPVFADVDRESWVLTPEIAAAHVEHEPIALVLPVATFGNPLDAIAWQRFIRQTGVPVVIDAAAALAAQEVVSGPVFCFSMHATKPFGCGEGGLVVGTDAALVEHVRRLSNFGIHDFSIDMLGTNAKMSEYHAAVGLAQFARWPAARARREHLYGLYRQGLAGLVTFQATAPGFVPSVLPVMLADGDARRHAETVLAAHDILTRRWYSLPLHRVPDMRGRIVNIDDAAFPVSMDLVERGMGIPFHTHLSNVDVARVIAVLCGVLAEEGAA